MNKVATKTVMPLPVDYTLTTVKETPVIGLVVYHSFCGRGLVVNTARDSWTIDFDNSQHSGDYSPSICYQRDMLSCNNPGFDSYMHDYIRYYS